MNKFTKNEIQKLKNKAFYLRMAALRELAGMSAQQYLLLRDQNPSVFGYNMQNEDYKLRKSGPDGKTNEKAIIIAMASTTPGSASM